MKTSENMCELEIGLLNYTQECLFYEKMNRIKGTVNTKSNPIEVWHQPNGRYYINEGHHRTYLSYWQGQKKVYAKVIEINENIYEHFAPIKNMPIIDSKIQRFEQRSCPSQEGLLYLFGESK